MLAGRAGMLAVQGGETLSGDSGAVKAVRRADIVDRNGELLATSVDVYSLYADPRAVWDPLETVDALADVIPDLDRDLVLARLSDRARRFEWIKRGLTPRQRQAVFNLGLEGLHFETERARAYPKGALAGHVLGATNIDGAGVAGVEYAQDDWLAAGDGPLRLTIDSGVQFALEAELETAAVEHDTLGAAGIVLDAETGAVRALASWPPVDPNRWAAHKAAARLDRAVGAPYDLGSVFKPFTVAAGLEMGAISGGQTFDLTTPVIVNGKEFEEHGELRRRATLADIIADSSNRGTVLIAQQIGADDLRAFLDDLGLLDRSPIELSASAAPLLPREWDELTLATTSFGHGMAVSPIAFAGAFSAFANNGVVVEPTLIEAVARRPRPPQRVMTPSTTAFVVDMMRETVLRGTGAGADAVGFRVAGKTGTAEKVVDGVYDEDRNVTSFAAVFPADDPKFVVFLLLDEPQARDGRGATAASNAAPAVGRVIERIAPQLGVAPVLEDVARAGPDQDAQRRSL